MFYKRCNIFNGDFYPIIVLKLRFFKLEIKQIQTKLSTFFTYLIGKLPWKIHNKRVDIPSKTEYKFCKGRLFTVPLPVFL